MTSFKLRNGMLLGSASAAAQVEGGDVGSNWSRWSSEGHILDSSSITRANDHWNRWREDCDLMKRMGLQICRMGVEWARIEPKPGEFDMSALEHYKEELRYLNSLGIKPLLTLHHFTHPLWFEDMGAFERKENIPIFLRFAEKTVEYLKDEVAEYITINEPNVYATNGYFFGIWPPGKKSFGETIGVLSVFAACHIKAYELIHKIRAEAGYKDTKVGFANHVRAFAPRRENSVRDRVTASLMKRFFQGSISKAMMTGRFEWPIRNLCGLEEGKYSDFIGVNYYSRSAVSGFSNEFFANVPVNDLGWEIYPAGIVECARELYDICALPIYITENGTCDNRDEFRAKYIFDHLGALCASGLPVERYYHWCFCDNFEWLEGESARFGIVRVDYETQERSVKRSGEFFSKIIERSGVDEALYKEYVEEEKYNVK